jgi:hypothetical protein
MVFSLSRDRRARELPKSILYIQRFNTGLVTQRSPLVTPIASQGLSLGQRVDALIDGLNTELSNRETIVRRPGLTKYCSVAVNKPLAFYSFRNIAGTIKLLVDTAAKVQTFTTGAVTDVYTKGASSQTRFQTVGNYVYMCNGTDAKKWDGTTVSTWGIVAPSTAASVGTTAGSLSPTSGYRYVYVFKNSSSGHISTASPVSASTGAQTSKNFTLSGSRSTDAQVDKVDIYRTKDGGSVYYFLAEIANPGAGSWNYTDSTVDASLNTDLTAPINHANDPVPTGANNLAFHAGRLWVSVNNYVYFAGGPDVTNGVPEEAWPTGNVFVFPNKVIAFASTSLGLLVFTASDLFVIRGVDSTSFYSQKLMANFGVLDQNCVAQDGDLLFVYTATRQLFALSESLDEIGFAIGDQLKANFDPANSYLVLHRNGSDGGLFISNGSSSIYRYNVAKEAWSPVAQPTGGVQAITSIAVAASDYRLLHGKNADGGFILYRDTTSAQDDGSNISAYATIGTLVAAPLGETAVLDAVLIERMPAGTDPTVSVMLNEITGSFTALPNPVADPPLLNASTTIIAKRHYLKSASTVLSQTVRHLQVKVSFPTENALNELLSFALMPPAKVA